VAKTAIKAYKEKNKKVGQATQVRKSEDNSLRSPKKQDNGGTEDGLTIERKLLLQKQDNANSLGNSA
jgi:hypothetical protein